MAALIAQGGARVILVDCDLRNPSLSRALAPEAEVGFLDVVGGNADLADAVWTDPATNMAFLPTVVNSRLPNATEMLASEAAKALFVSLQIKYDYVIVDLAPLVAGVDVRVASRLIDSYILVIEWGSHESRCRAVCAAQCARCAGKYRRRCSQQGRYGRLWAVMTVMVPNIIMVRAKCARDELN